MSEHSKRTDQDFADEIRAHIALEADRLIDEGMDPSHATHTARKSFGNIVNHQERFYRSIRWMWFDNLIRDIRYGIRSLRRDKSLFVFATLIVGLGIGATATVFSVTNTLLVQPLPFTDPDRLVLISNGQWGKGQRLSALTAQVAYVQSLQDESRLLADVAGFHQFDFIGDHTFSGAGEPERLTRLRVTGNFFEVLGVQPEVGRSFSEAESQFGGPPAIMLSYGWWNRRFGADPGIVGQAISIDNTPVSVVGVLPAEFDFEAIFEPGRRIDYYEPFPLSAETNRTGNTLSLIARLNPGASIPAAQSEAIALAERTEGERLNGFNPYISPLREHVSGRFRTALYILVGAVVLVMLIVCANLSNLLLARGVTREKEMAVRSALGAARPRIIRQMLTESLVLTGAGAVLGIGVAWWATGMLAQLGADIPLLSEVRVDRAVLGFTVIIAMTTGIALGVAPALRLSQLQFNETLKESSRSTTESRRHRSLRNTLVVTEVALACVLLVGAGLLLRSFDRLVNVDLGFRPQQTITIRIDSPGGFATHEERSNYYRNIVDQMNTTPGIAAAGLSDVIPMAFNRRWCVNLLQDEDECAVAPYVRTISDGYVAAMGLSLLRGRDFSRQDNASRRPVVLINEALANRIWPEENPLDRTININRTEWDVVGVVKGMRYLAPDQEPGPELFFPLWQQTNNRGAVHLLARGDQSLQTLTSATRQVLAAADPTLPLGDLRNVQEIVDDSVSARRFIMMLLTGFAALAIILASLGIYGVISHSVGQRRQETGLRIALGAPAGELRKQVLIETLKLATIGVLIGLVAAAVLGRFMQSLLYDITPADPITFTLVPVVLLAIAALAGYLPARRASEVDPMIALNP